MPGDSGATVVTTLCLLPMHRGCGCTVHPAFPTPSIPGAKDSRATRAHRAARSRTHVMRTSLRGALATKHSTLSFFTRSDGLLRFARNDGLKSAALSPQSLPCQLRPSTQRHQLGLRDIPAHRRHAAIGGRDDIAL